MSNAVQGNPVDLQKTLGKGGKKTGLSSKHRGSRSRHKLAKKSRAKTVARAAADNSADRVRVLLNGKASVNKQDATGSCAIHWAARTGNCDIMDLLIAAKADLGARSKNSNTAFHEAAWKGHNPIIEILLRHPESLPVDITNKGGATCLLWAAWRGHGTTASLLLEYGADPTIRDKKGRTARDFARAYKHYHIFDIIDPVIKSRSESSKSPVSATESNRRQEGLSKIREEIREADANRQSSDDLHREGNGEGKKNKEEAGDLEMDDSKNTKRRNSASVVVDDAAAAAVEGNEGTSQEQPHVVVISPKGDEVLMGAPRTSPAKKALSTASKKVVVLKKGDEDDSHAKEEPDTAAAAAAVAPGLQRWPSIAPATLEAFPRSSIIRADFHQPFKALSPIAASPQKELCHRHPEDSDGKQIHFGEHEEGDDDNNKEEQLAKEDSNDSDGKRILSGEHEEGDDDNNKEEQLAKEDNTDEKDSDGKRIFSGEHEEGDDDNNKEEQLAKEDNTDEKDQDQLVGATSEPLGTIDEIVQEKDGGKPDEPRKRGICRTKGRGMCSSEDGQSSKSCVVI